MIDHFDVLAPWYDRLLRQPDVGRLARLLGLPSPGRLLDAGGGTGRVSEHLQGSVGTVVVSDLSQRMLKRARAKHIPCVRAHAEKLPFENGQFEHVLVVDALHHFCDQQQAIEDLIRVLKPGGRMLIEEFDLNKLPVQLLAMLEKMFLMGSRFLHPETIADMIAAHRLTVRIESGGRFAAWIVAEKTRA
jgi:demethylmenaquinone methyltransferase/2-methoxy-6-polyprenyl-1,4-benzoquinol methylase